LLEGNELLKLQPKRRVCPEFGGARFICRILVNLVFEDVNVLWRIVLDALSQSVLCRNQSYDTFAFGYELFPRELDAFEYVFQNQIHTFEGKSIIAPKVIARKIKHHSPPAHFDLLPSLDEGVAWVTGLTGFKNYHCGS
jgi:hypothetical protein